MSAPTSTPMSAPAAGTRRLPVLLLALALGLAVALAWLWARPASPLHAPAWTAPAPQLPQLDAPGALQKHPGAEAVGAATLDRPLFSDSRRPGPAAAGSAPAAAPPVALDKARLLGIVASPAFSALLVEVEGNPRTLRRGERIGDWEWVDLRGRRASFRRGTETRTLDLPYSHAGPAAGASAAAAAGAPAPAAARKAAAAPASMAAPASTATPASAASGSANPPR